MKNLKVFCVNIKKLERFSDEYFDIIGLNQLSKRIEKGLNKKIRKKLRKGKKLEDLEIVAVAVRNYPFEIDDVSIREQFYKNLSSENIKITEKYLDDLTFIDLILSCFSNQSCTTPMCIVELDVNKILQKKL